jgi:hypothetical protein
MRAYHHKKSLCSQIITSGLFTALTAILPSALAEPQVAMAHVVTAPWAAPSQAPGAKQLQLEPAVAKWEPPPLAVSPPPPPLAPEQQQIVQATKGEQIPEPKWARYVLSNEWRHDVLFPKIAGLGGVFIGVATDQNYTMAAAARAELLVLMDYDSEVVNVHRIYHAFMKVAPTAQELRALFQQKNAAHAAEILSTAGTSKEDSAKLVQIYNRYRDRMATYLFHVANVRVGQRHPTWLGDPDAYSYVRALVVGGRVIARQGDLNNGTTTLKSIGDTARALKMNVRAIYTSNAEGFWKYSPTFRDNLRSLPHDDKTVVIRTYKRNMPSAAGDTWHYNIHQLNDFLERLDNPVYQNIHRIMQDLRQSPRGRVDDLGVSYYDGSVPRS